MHLRFLAELSEIRYAARECAVTSGSSVVYAPHMELGIRRRLVLDITLNNLFTGCYGVEERLFLDKLAGESIRHVAMKLLAWLVTYQPGLEIEASVGEHYKPDLVRVDHNGKIRDWVDCGQTSITKLKAVYRRHSDATIVIVKASRGELHHTHLLCPNG